PQLMEDIIASGQADVVQAARALLADPDFPNKARAGIEPRRCLRCLSCFSDEMSYCQPFCSINPESGRELEMRADIPPVVKKKILIAGGGIGGMQAAITCSQRGHEVILCEKSHQLGGVLRCEDGVYFKKNLEHYLNYQAAEALKAGADIRLNTEVTPEFATKINADVIIAAIGATPAKPAIRGIDGANVFAAQDAYTALDKVGENVVIIGAGLVGVELGLHLIHNGKKVTIVEMTDHISDGGNFLHIPGLKTEIKKAGLEIKFNTAVKEITPSGVICDNGTYGADTVIYATGQIPLREKAAALAFCAPEFEMIGDCVSPRNITAATREAFMLSRNIGRF
ncbi:MAG: FAD-dependent oxidoreductase, partial [Oscillospiraceae bacterium]|nr:FAD-dependent oxidoreductase [Oscillospiraceae bacterium]